MEKRARMYRMYVDRMTAASSATDRKTVVADMCRQFAFSTAKAYNVLKEHGWESGRAKRKDSGTTSLDETLLLAVAAMAKLGIRKNGKTSVPVNVIRSILQSRGLDLSIGDSRLRELLRIKHLSVEDSKLPTPHQPMRSEYPNQVHCVDPSVALLYYAPGGKQKIVGDDEEYKNKHFLKDKPKCWRYVLTDHYSASLCIRYYADWGETAANMYDFLLYAWGQKSLNAYVFHGVPELLIWDCGSGNLARATTNALAAFGVKTRAHLPGNPRAKGQVEQGNRLVETQFESRLRFEPVGSIEELNAAAERWCAAYNANLIPGLDTRLRRDGMIVGVRTTLWQRIKPEHLRELPDEQTCRQVFSRGVQSRKVSGDLSISMVHPQVSHSLRYSLRDLPGVLVGMTVNVQPVLLGTEPRCMVSYEHEGEEVSFEVEPIQYDEAGFRVDAPVFGERYKRPKDTARETAAKTLEKPGLAAVMGPAHSFINPENPFMQQQEGTPISVVETVPIHELLISAVEAAKRFKAQCGEVPEGFINTLREQYPQGVPTRIVDDLIHAHNAKTHPGETMPDRGIRKFA
jgi:hypothetical protein